MRIEGLDKISEQLQENYDRYVKELAIDLEKATDTVNTTAMNISRSLDQTNNILETYMNSFHSDLDLAHIGVNQFTASNIDTS